MAHYILDDQQKFEGALLGAALGDALGWPNEQRASNKSTGPATRGSEMQPWTKRSGGRFQPVEETIPGGSYSDDTQLILAVARARLRHERWWQFLADVEYPFWTAYQRGGGGASLRAARLLLRGRLPWESSLQDRARYFDAGGNGVAMRVTPHCLLGYQDERFDAIATNVVADGVLTHGHPVALLGALAYAYVLWRALRVEETLAYGQLLNFAIEHSDEWSQFPNIDAYWPTWQEFASEASYRTLWTQISGDLLQRLRFAKEALSAGALSIEAETLQGLGCFDKKISGAGTVAAAASIFLASKHAANPFEGVAQAAFATGADTDTLASMTGAIVGAVSGTSWLARYRKQIQDEQSVTATARALLGTPQVLERGPIIRVTQGSIKSFLASLSGGEQGVRLPNNQRARILGDGGVRSMSPRIAVSSWLVLDENHQSLTLKSIRKKDGIDNSTAAFGELLNHHGREPEKTKSRFVGVSVLTRNLKASRHFYCDLLGVPVTKESANVLQLGEYLALRQAQHANSASDGLTIYVDVDNVQSRWEALRRARTFTISGIEDKGERLRFTCFDPDRRRVEVFQKKKMD